MTIEFKIPHQIVFNESILEDLSISTEFNEEQINKIRTIFFAESILGWKSPLGQRNMTACRFIKGNSHVDIVPIVARSSTVPFWLKVFGSSNIKSAENMKEFLLNPVHKKIVNHIEKTLWVSSKLIVTAPMDKAWAPPPGIEGPEPGEYFMIQACKFANKAIKLGMTKKYVLSRIDEFIL